jgi:hypothetical protein
LRNVFNSEPSRLNAKMTKAAAKTHSITNPNVASSVAPTTFASNQLSAVVNHASTGIQADLLYDKCDTSPAQCWQQVNAVQPEL